jgi:hypothetical protein
MVSEGPRKMVKQASVVLSCIDEKSICKRHAKNGCLPRILPERCVSGKPGKSGKEILSSMIPVEADIDVIYVKRHLTKEEGRHQKEYANRTIFLSP